MNLPFASEQQIIGAVPNGGWVAQGIRGLMNAIGGAWDAEHKDDDTHGAVTADSLLSRGAVTTSQTQSGLLGSGSTNNYPLAATTAVLLLTPASGGSTLSGLSAAAIGRHVWIFNVGADALSITANDAASTAVARFTPAATIAAGHGVEAIWASGQWRLVL